MRALVASLQNHVNHCSFPRISLDQAPFSSLKEQQSFSRVLQAAGVFARQLKTNGKQFALGSCLTSYSFVAELRSCGNNSKENRHIPAILPITFTPCAIRRRRRLLAGGSRERKSRPTALSYAAELLAALLFITARDCGLSRVR